MNMEFKVKFFGDIIKNLKTELDMLTIKIQKTRETTDVGTYKNLIMAYKEVLGLYYNLMYEKEEKDQITNINNTFKFDEVVNAIKQNDKFKIGRDINNVPFYEGSMVNKEYEKVKRMQQYAVNLGIFYKYMFKCAENEKINVIFYCQSNNKIMQFKNICQSKEFENIFRLYFKDVMINKESIEITLHNDSNIKFIIGGNNSMGYRYHYAVIDTDIDIEIYNDAIKSKDILFDIAKKENRLKDNFNIDFIEM